ncbi:glutathione S-transferase family protein [Undibacterium sp. TS12]|uniref:glutathione S-transferase family protein n=1 Tax=Undibacterium sp. TS12 TaxID=2908202 RepID=UPI001F4C9387|nr:glutathione S-transferase family protein [Undibacterium sp. TS12]MCH8618565.1 glutathione S-transferase family protein [Undibacterium sp. TS12]
MRLFGSSDSGHSFKVRSFLLLAKIPHDYQWIDLAQARKDRPAEFVAVSRFGEVPVLLDEGQALCQSNAILIYLAQKYQRFCGSSNQEWQTILEWLSWETNRIGFSVPNLRYALRWAPQPGEVLSFLRDRGMLDLQTLDNALSSSEFLLPSGPSIADLSCSAYLYWLDQVAVDEGDFPHLQRWLARLRSLPCWTHPDVALHTVGL